MSSTSSFNPAAAAFVPSFRPVVSKAAPKQMPLTCTGHTRPVVDLCFSDIIESTNEYYLISGCKDSVPILRKGRTGDWIGSFQGHKGAVWSSILSRDATLSVTGSADFTAKVWANHDGSVLSTLNHKHVVRVVDITIDNSYLLTAGLERKIRIFDLQAQGEPMRILEGHDHDIKSAVFDGQNGLIFHGDGPLMKIWDMRERNSIGTRKFDANVTSVKFSLDRKFIICTAGKKYNSANATLERDFILDVNVSSASIHPNHTKLLVGAIDDVWLRVLDYNTGAELEVLKAHHGPCWMVSYSPDGELFASGSEDGTVRLWQTTPGKAYGLWPAQL